MVGAAGLRVVAGLTLQRELGWQGRAGREGKLGNFLLFSVLPDTAFKALLSGTLTVFCDLTMPYLGTGTVSDLLNPCLYLYCASALCMILLYPTLCVFGVFGDTFLCIYLCNLGVTDLPVSLSVVYTECAESLSDSSDS